MARKARRTALAIVGAAVAVVSLTACGGEKLTPAEIGTIEVKCEVALQDLADTVYAAQGLKAPDVTKANRSEYLQCVARDTAIAESKK